MEKKKAKEEERELNRLILEEKKTKKQEKEKILEEKEKQKEEERLKEEEIERKIREDLKKKEEEEFNKWKDCFDIKEEGEEFEDLTSENMINDFINYIKTRKIVSLEDLSGKFKLSFNELIEKLNYLENSNRLCGIIDDRGKYIFLTEKELKVNKNFINYKSIEKLFVQRGRINKNELIKECNKIIRFEPTDEDKIIIQKEQKNIIKSIEKEIESSKNL